MTALAGKSALVTGAGGFVGANLTRALVERGARVHAMLRPGGDPWRLSEILPQLAAVHQADLVDAEATRRVLGAAQPALVFHLAAPAGHPVTAGERADLVAGAVMGTSNLLDATADLSLERLVHMGSSLEYGPRTAPLRESDAPEPTTFRGAAKAAATLLCRHHAQFERLPIVVLRPFSVYGPWEVAGRFIPAAVRAALTGGSLPLTRPEVRHDFVFVEDVVEACLAAGIADGDGLAGEIINIGSGTQWTNDELVDLLASVVGCRIDVRRGAFATKAADTSHWVANIDKAKRLLGWQPRHTLRAGLEKTVAWFRPRL